MRFFVFLLSTMLFATSVFAQPAKHHVDTIVLTVMFQVSKCDFINSPPSGNGAVLCDAPGSIAAPVSIPLTDCHQGEDGNSECSGLWNQTIERDGYQFYSAVNAIKHSYISNSGIKISYCELSATASAGINSQPSNTVHVYLGADCELTDTVHVDGQDLIVSGNDGYVAYRPSLAIGPVQRSKILKGK